MVDEGGFEPPKRSRNRFTVCPLWPLGNSSIGNWSWWTDSNPRPADYKSAALPAELHQRFASVCPAAWESIAEGKGVVKNFFRNLKRFFMRLWPTISWGPARAGHKTGTGKGPEGSGKFPSSGSGDDNGLPGRPAGGSPWAPGDWARGRGKLFRKNSQKPMAFHGVFWYNENSRGVSSPHQPL